MCVHAENRYDVTYSRPRWLQRATYPYLVLHPTIRPLHVFISHIVAITISDIQSKSRWLLLSED